MKGLAKKIAMGTMMLMMTLSVMMTTPLYADCQTEAQAISPLDYLDPIEPVEN